MKKELQIKIEQNIAKNEDELFSQISKLIDDARSHVQTAVNTVMVYTVDPIKLNFNLSWNHYQILMRIENQEERQFYEDGESDA